MRIVAKKTALLSKRVKAGLSIRQIAKKSCLSPGTYQNIESGNRSARPDTAVKICDALGITFDSIFSIEGAAHDE